MRSGALRRLQSASGCTAVVHPVSGRRLRRQRLLPTPKREELAAAIVDWVEAGAHVIRLSLGLSQLSGKPDPCVEDALDCVIRRSVIVLAAAGNMGVLESPAVTRHSWVIPVVACDLRGRPTSESNMGSSIGRHGFRAIALPVQRGRVATHALRYERSRALCDGRDCAPLVGVPGATAAEIKAGVCQVDALRRASVVPTLLNAAAAY